MSWLIVIGMLVILAGIVSHLVVNDFTKEKNK